MEEQLENFILDDNLLGDDTYITNGDILLKKSALDPWCDITDLLIKIQTKTPIHMEYIPYDKGIEVTCPDKIDLWSNDILAVPFGDKFFNYEYLKLVHILTEDISFYTLVPPSEKFENSPWILKFWDGNGEFVGCLAEIVR